MARFIGFSNLLMWLPLQAAGAAYSPFVPPPMIECRDVGYCDRDPAHLAAFLTAFYRWNLFTDDAIWSDGNSVDGKTLSNYIAWKADRLEAFLTEAFRRYSYHRSHDPEYEGDPRYCNHSPEVNEMTCSQDTGEDWTKKASASIETMHSSAATAIVALSGADEQGDRLRVELEVEHGYWRIASVNWLADDR